MRVDFYHLTATPLERVLPRICERIVGEGGRLLVVADDELLERLNQLLWTYAADSFLPHGREGEGAERQPILLSSACAAVNGARNIALTDGEWRDEALGFDRAFYFFDEAGIANARAAWRQLKAREDAELGYWKQDERGKWVEGP